MDKKKIEEDSGISYSYCIFILVFMFFLGSWIIGCPQQDPKEQERQKEEAKRNKEHKDRSKEEKRLKQLDAAEQERLKQLNATLSNQEMKEFLNEYMKSWVFCIDPRSLPQTIVKNGFKITVINIIALSGEKPETYEIGVSSNDGQEFKILIKFKSASGGLKEDSLTAKFYKVGEKTYDLFLPSVR